MEYIVFDAILSVTQDRSMGLSQTELSISAYDRMRIICGLGLTEIVRDYFNYRYILNDMEDLSDWKQQKLIQSVQKTKNKEFMELFAINVEKLNFSRQFGPSKVFRFTDFII